MGLLLIHDSIKDPIFPSHVTKQWVENVSNSPLNSQVSFQSDLFVNMNVSHLTPELVTSDGFRLLRKAVFTDDHSGILIAKDNVCMAGALNSSMK